MDTACTKTTHATLKHARTIGMIGMSHQKLKQLLKINVASDAPHLERYVNLAAMAHKTTYHQTLKCSPSEYFHGHLLYNTLDLKYGHPLPPCGTTDIKMLGDQANQKNKANADNTFSAFFNLKIYFDKKT